MVTFDVHTGIEAQSDPLYTAETADVFAHLLGGGARPEACSSAGVQLADPMGFHALIEAAHVAFSEHYGLELDPDSVWVTIAQGFARLVNAEPELFRDKFVAHQGKETICIRRDDFVLGSPDNDWTSCFSQFSDAIRGFIGDEKHELLTADFSTTGNLQRAVSEVVLMDTVQAYFTYEVRTMCGIPFVTLHGTAADWQTVREKVKGLRQFADLDWWLNDVDAILKHFVAAAAGAHVDTEFWNSLYKVNSQSGGTYLTGWIAKFLPLVKDSRDDSKYQRNPILGTAISSHLPDGGRWRSSRRGNHVDMSGDTVVGTAALPSSLSTVPFQWNYYGSVKPYQFIAGVVGYTQSEDGRSVRPVMGWAVRPAR